MTRRQHNARCVFSLVAPEIGQVTGAGVGNDLPGATRPRRHQVVEFATVIPNRTEPGYCSPSVYVDGVWLQQLNPGESLADVVRVDELLAVEVYEWPFGVPREYTGNQACGVILFWTGR